LPQSWIEGQAALQRQILRRERELGMTPVTPAFSGFLPPAILKKYPNVHFWRSSTWAGFESSCLLNPRDPSFPFIGKRFVERIMQNAPVYELVTDLMWQTKPMELSKWLRDYCRNRYGTNLPEAQTAWGAIFAQAYSGGWGRPRYVRRPSPEGIGEPGPELEQSRQLVQLFLASGDWLI